MSPASTAPRRIFERVWYAFWTVAGARPPASSSATHARTSSCVMAPSGSSPKAGITWLRMYASSRARDDGRRLTVVAHHASTQSAVRTLAPCGSRHSPRC